MRHIHITPEDAEALGVADKEIVSVKLDTPRSLVFGDVVVRVSASYATAMHIDTDEANAACAFGKCEGTIVK
jgi:putative phosphotransacetylase